MPDLSAPGKSGTPFERRKYGPYHEGMNESGPQPPPVRKLRLSAILAELCEGAAPAVSPEVPSTASSSGMATTPTASDETRGDPPDEAGEPVSETPAAAPPPSDSAVVDLSASAGSTDSANLTISKRRRLPLLRRKPRVRSNITIGEIVDRTARAGFGFIFAFLALVSIPFVGLSTPFGLAIAFGAVQMILGFEHPWLPQRVRRHAVSMQTLNWLSHKLARWTAGLEKIVKPRFSLLSRGPFWMLCGVGVLLQALGLALPLPIPGSNWPFIFLIVLYAIGLLELDGLLIMICHALTMVEVALAVESWEKIVEAVMKMVQWFRG